MKAKIILLFISIIFLTGCDDFLEPKSQDKIIPKNIDDLSEFLLGEVIISKQDAEPYLAYMTDDVGDHFNMDKERDKKTAYWGYYTWQQEPELTKENSENTDPAWNLYYHKIFMCNVILDEISEVEGDVDYKNKLKAECLFMRAHSYFRLINLYGEAYNKITAPNLMGVPINNSVSIENKRYKRESVENVYKKIEEDLISSTELFIALEDKSVSVARPSIAAAYLLLSRMYLYMKEYTEAEKYASLAIDNSNSSIMNLNSDFDKEFISIDNPEIIFTYGNKKKYDFSYMFGCISYRTSEDLLSKYTSSDKRKDLFFKSKYFGYRPNKFKSGTTNSYGKAYRIYEAYLNRAEANYYLSEYGKALKDLKYIYTFRHDDEEDIQITDNSDILDLIKLDRRLEFCFENHRWFDLRRYGMPELKHRYLTEEGEINCSLPELSKAYTLPIPRNIRSLNSEIERIQRPELNNK
ncbi:MAG: RagB/SusD family nutrient uptake outer membrane protein [Marinifilaceae bacterium]|jgi:hypothetical protein|nr:RagB/SusD family nutrient uptake outer membrane protein [Marinifilaceae bacterium]